MVTDAENGTLVKDIQKKTGITGSHPQEAIIMCSLISQKIGIAMYAKKTKSARARCNTKKKQHVDGTPPSTKFGYPNTADHKIPNVRSELRCGYGHALIVHEEFVNWIQSDENKRHIRNYVVFTKVCPAATQTGTNLHRHVKRID